MKKSKKAIKSRRLTNEQNVKKPKKAIKPRKLTNSIISETLPLAASDPEKARKFLSLFYLTYEMFLIDDENMELLKEYHSKGDGYAAFALGRYHKIVHPQEDSMQVAWSLYEEARAKGIADAITEMAIMLRYGFAGTFDRERAKELLEEALAAGSRLAERRIAYDLKAGMFGSEKNLGKALSMVNRQIMRDGEDLHLLILKCQIIDDIYGTNAAIPYYQNVADLGSATAWDWLLTIYFSGIGSNEELEKHLEKGIIMEIGIAYYIKAVMRADKDPESRIPMLEKAMSLGCEMAAAELGNIYCERGQKEKGNYLKAWELYTRGMQFNWSECAERLVEMAEKKMVETDEETLDRLMISGARMGWERLIAKVVEAYNDGCLTQYAGEIEKYHIPAFNALDPEKLEELEDYFDDEDPDDDGRYDAYA